MSFSVFSVTQKWCELGSIPLNATQSLPSTNDLAKEKAFTENEALTLYLTDQQTKGRGRGNNSWISNDPGDCLYTSFSLLTRGQPQPILAPALGLALFKAAQSTWLGHKWSLKAPNDLYLLVEGVGPKKVAGILLETVQQGNQSRVIFGLGMNIFNSPNLESAACLADVLDEAEITQESWMSFLDHLLLEITQTMMITKNELSISQRVGLLYALNEFQNPNEKIREITEDGSLHFRTGKVMHWFDL